MSRASVPKSEATRERILEAAFAQFAERGYAAATMRDIADRAGCSLGLSYRYFRSKDAITLALYQRMLDEFAAEAESIAPGRLAQRWAGATRSDFARLARHRMALAGLTNAGLTPGGPAQVLGGEARPIRLRMLAIFGMIVSGATDVPRAASVESLANVLYGAHLLLVLFWLQDPTPNQAATSSLIGLIEDLLGTLRFALRIPWLRDALERLAGILKPILEGDAGASQDSLRQD